METLYLHFDTTTAEGGKLAAELQDYLEENCNQRLELVKERDDTQDAGTILAIILGAGSVVELAKGISAWLQKRNNVTLTLTKNSKGKDSTTIVATGLSSKDIPGALKGFEKLSK